MHAATIIALIAATVLIRALAWRIPRLCRVVRVVDGDSIEISRSGRTVKVRLASVDAPEWNQPGGREASAALRALVGRSRVVAAPIAIDAYGREVCRVLTRRGPASARMVLAGHAWATTAVGAPLQFAAVVARRGLWARRDAIDPRVWRKAFPSGRVTSGRGR